MRVEHAVLVINRSRMLVRALIHVQKYINKNKRKLGPSWKGMDIWLSDAVAVSRMQLYAIVRQAGMTPYLKPYERFALTDVCKRFKP